MNRETRIAYCEVSSILEILGEELSSKIPKKLRDYIEREKDLEYEPKIKDCEGILSRELREKTLAIIAAFNIHYWLESEEEKQELLKRYARKWRRKRKKA